MTPDQLDTQIYFDLIKYPIQMTGESINIARTSTLSIDTKLAIIASPQFYLRGKFQDIADKFREELSAAIKVHT